MDACWIPLSGQNMSITILDDKTMLSDRWIKINIYSGTEVLYCLAEVYTIRYISKLLDSYPRVIFVWPPI